MEKSTDVLKIPQMLLIGSAGRNSGKTTLAASFIKKWGKEYPIYALKVISINSVNEACHRGSEGCGICTSLEEDFELLEEENREGTKDTSKLLKAGASRAFLLKTFRSHMREGIEYFMSKVPQGACIVCESNSIRNVVEPGVFLFVKNKTDTSMKPSARSVYHLADQIIESEKEDMEGMPAVLFESEGGFKINCGMKREGE